MSSTSQVFLPDPAFQDMFWCLGWGQRGLCGVPGARLETSHCGKPVNLAPALLIPTFLCAMISKAERLLVSGSSWCLWMFRGPWVGHTAAGLRWCCLVLCISQCTFPVYPPHCYNCPNFHPTKSQLIYFCMPFGRDVVIFVSFTTVNKSAFDYIGFFWGYSQLVSFFTLDIPWDESWVKSLVQAENADLCPCILFCQRERSSW